MREIIIGLNLFWQWVFLWFKSNLFHIGLFVKLGEPKKKGGRTW